jgi:hypothetical protein
MISTSIKVRSWSRIKSIQCSSGSSTNSNYTCKQ